MRSSHLRTSSHSAHTTADARDTADIADHRVLSDAMDVVERQPSSGDVSIGLQTLGANGVAIRTRYDFLEKLCTAFMAYGAPTHRLEGYMRLSAEALEIKGQFLYLPSCMVASYTDEATGSSEVKILRVGQAVDFSKLKDTHRIYSEVVNGKIDAGEALEQLVEVVNRGAVYGPWLLILMYGFASVSVAPWAFGARFIDLPIIFVLGTILGFLQFSIGSRSDVYANMFEITAAVLLSFLARAFGSIGGGKLFCFSALAQSAMAMILPGYVLLCASLELQSKNIISGSVRLVFIMFYTLVLAFGMGTGMALYGVMDRNATSALVCDNPMATPVTFIFVPIFALCLVIMNGGRPKQMFVMVFIATAGFFVAWSTAFVFPTSPQVPQILAAFAIGILGHLATLFRHGLASATMLPAMFVLVPAGLAIGATLITGLTEADQLNNAAGHNGTTTVSDAPVESVTVVGAHTLIFNVVYTMLQLAIGLTIGLFLSSMVMHPFLRKKRGIFNF